MHTLAALCGLLISTSGDSSSVALAGFNSVSSCTSSSISVVSVPFESTGDGSTCCGYGLGGGARLSVGADDLDHNEFSRCMQQGYDGQTYLFSPTGNMPYGAGEAGESE